MNNDLISRSALIADFDMCNNRNAKWTPQRVKTLLIRATAVDAVEVVHGEWDWNGKHWECSNCRRDRLHDLVLGLDAAYCPYCGAKMERTAGGGEELHKARRFLLLRRKEK